MFFTQILMPIKYLYFNSLIDSFQLHFILQYMYLHALTQESTGKIKLHGVGLGLGVGSGLVPSYYLVIVITKINT